MLNGGAGATAKWKQVAARKLKLGTLKNEVSQTMTSRRVLEHSRDVKYRVLATFFAFPSAKNSIPHKSVTRHTVTNIRRSAETLAH